MDDDTNFADFLDGDGDGDPTARGIVQCLKMLADEAAALGLGRTLSALETAMKVCVGESDSDDADEDLTVRPPAGTLLH
jgi:hypothetical protein